MPSRLETEEGEAVGLVITATGWRSATAFRGCPVAGGAVVLETGPRRVIDYRGARFEEMDLDAVLARHPKVALIDELAHTNVPGSCHAK